MPHSLVEIYESAGGTYCHPSSRQGNIHSTLNKEAAGSTAVSINFYQINHCIPKEKINITSKPIKANNHECKQIPGFL